jgi:hypothetical protein
MTYGQMEENASHGLYALWEHTRTPVYTAPVDNEEALQRRVVYVCQTISTSPGTF